MPDMMGEALKYAGLGMAVFPLLPRSKEPATKHGFKDASRDMDQVKTWWSENPEYNIGIATGALRTFSHQPFSSGGNAGSVLSGPQGLGSTP